MTTLAGSSTPRKVEIVKDLIRGRFADLDAANSSDVEDLADRPLPALQGAKALRNHA